MSNQVPNRSGDGVRAQLFPRTDFSQWGWLGATYQPRTQTAWEGQPDCFRVAERKQQRERRLLYTDFPQQGWIRKPTGNLFEYRQRSWHVPTVLTPDGARLREKRLHYADFQQQGWIQKPTGNLFEYRERSWHVPSERTGTKKQYWLDTNQQPAWIYAGSLGATYNPSVNDWNTETSRTGPSLKWMGDTNTSLPFGSVPGIDGDWHIDTVRASSPTRSSWYATQPLDGWWAAAFTGTFDPSTFPWSNYGYGDRPFLDQSLFQDAAKGQARGGFGGGEAPAPFDPSVVNWTVDSGVPAKRQSPSYWRNALKASQSFGLLDVRPLQPSFDQLGYSSRMRGRNIRPNISDDLFGWVWANLPTVFDASLLPHVSDDRTRDRYQKAPRLDQFSQAWIAQNLPPFDVSLTAHSGDPFRMGDRARLVVALYQFYSDLSWTHDVLGLIDPPVVPDVILPRPIAPIMAARRRNKRRR